MLKTVIVLAALFFVTIMTNGPSKKQFPVSSLQTLSTPIALSESREPGNEQRFILKSDGTWEFENPLIYSITQMVNYPFRTLIPEGYVGWVTIYSGVKDIPPLPIEDGYITGFLKVFTWASSGRLITEQDVGEQFKLLTALIAAKGVAML